MALTEIVNEVNSGGTTTEFHSSVFTALTENDFYLFEIGVKNADGASANNFRIAINGESYATSGTAWIRAYTYGDTGTTYSGDPASPLFVSPAASSMGVIRGIIGEVGGTVFMADIGLAEDATKRMTWGGHFHNSATNCTQLGIVSDASDIGDDTYVKVWPVTDFTSVADVTVSGGSVTKMDTGVFTALQEGKQYLFFSSFVRDGTNFADDLRINDQSTGYETGRLGTNDGDYNSGTSSYPYITSSGVVGNIGVAWGTCGVFNSKPYVSYVGAGVFSTSMRADVVSSYHTTETNFDQLTLTADANEIGDGSRILIVDIEP